MSFKPSAPCNGACETSSGKNGGLSLSSIFRERLPHEILLALAMLTMVLSAVSARSG